MGKVPPEQAQQFRQGKLSRESQRSVYEEAIAAVV